VIPVICSSKNITERKQTVVEYVRNVTDRKRSEAALRESEEKFRTLVEKSPIGIALISDDGHYKYINPQFSTIFGYTIEDIPNGNAWFQKSFPNKFGGY
jgi:PAS domain-containing protein